MNLKMIGKRLGAILAAMMMTLSTLLASPVLAAAPDELTATVIDDTDSEVFVFEEDDGKTSGWQAEGTAGNPAEQTEHWSNVVGTKAVLTFTGTKVELYGPKKSNHRIITVSIDGGEAVDADCYAAQTEPDALLFSADGLENKEHTLTITTTDRANEAAVSASGVSITYAKVYAPQAVTPEPEPVITSTVVDDTDSSFVFDERNGKTGGWAVGNLSSLTDTWAQTEHWSNAVGAKAVLTFTGTKVELYGPKKSNHRIITVSIDGGEAVDADCYAASEDLNALLFSSDELENNEHTLTITTTDRANEAAAGATGVSITYAKVYAPQTAVPDPDPDPVYSSTVIDDVDSRWSFEGTDPRVDGWGGGASGAASSTEHWSQAVGAVATLKFEGDKIEVYGVKDKSHRYLSFQIDDGEVIEVDTYASSRDEDALLFSSSDQNIVLENARHTLTITTLDKTNESLDLSGGGKAGCSITYAIAYGYPIEAAALNAYVGDEKLLDLAESYDTLKLGSGASWSGTAWKGDALSSKIIAASGSKDLDNVKIEASDFTDGKGNTYSKNNIEISWLDIASARQSRNNGSPTANAGALKHYPDIISRSSAPISISKSDVRFAWLTLNVPAEQAAGTYTGKITVSADQLDEPIELNYSLEVIDLELPEENSFELQLWQHPYSVANYYLGFGQNVQLGGVCNQTDPDFYFSENHFKLMKSEMEDYAAAGGHDAVANIVPEAWNHQSFYNDPTMVSWTLKSDGSWSFDYTDYDKWIEFMIETGVINPETNLGKIKCYSIVPWENVLSYYDEASASQTSKTFNPATAQWTTVWSAFLTDFLKHSDEKGWTGITYIALDERDLAQVQPAAQLVKSIKNAQGQSFKVSACMNKEVGSNYAVSDLVDDMAMNQGNTDSRSDMEALFAHRKGLGLDTSVYTCVGDYPGSFMMSDPGDNYWSILHAVSIGANGYLKWAFDNYLYDMYGDASYKWWEPGDGWFIYPEQRSNYTSGQEANFYSTPRYEMLKQGQRDARKIQYLQETNRLTDAQKADLNAALQAMTRPSTTTTNGAITYANDAQRRRTHEQTAAVADAMNAAGRIAAGSEETNDRTELQKQIDAAKAVVEENYTAASAAAVKSALEQAEAVNTPDAAQSDINAKAQALKSAIEALVSKVTVTFKDGDTVLKTQKVEPGQGAQAPEAPEKEGYEFKGWDKEFTNVTSDLVVLAVYEKLPEPAVTYTVTFKDGDTVLKTETVESGKAASAPEAPEKEGYEFKGWDKEFTNVTSDLVVLAVYEKLTDSVDYSALDQAISEAEKVSGKYSKASKKALDDALDAGKAIRTSSDASQKDVDDAAKAINDAVSRLVRVYTVVFMDGNTVLKTQEVESGKDAQAPEAPVKDGHVFKQWDQPYTNVTSDLTIRAIYLDSEPEPELDTSKLEKAVSDAQKLKKETYTASSWDALQKALTSAQAVLKDPVTQKEIDQATKQLEDAIKDLDVNIYRIYNKNNGEHLFTTDKVEYDYLASIGWQAEGIAWIAPASGREMTRLYNKNSGEHHYTSDSNEISYLEKLGWKNEGCKWYSADKENGLVIHRLYNPNAEKDPSSMAGAHHYTLSDNEKDYLDSIGWNWEHNESALIYAKRKAPESK